MSRKSKGINAERELIHLFHSKEGWGAIRAAGSGSMKYPCADILASNSKRYIALECKSSKEDKKYIDKEDIDELFVFSKKFGAEPWIGVRFTNTQWFFILADKLKSEGKCVVISKQDIEHKGVTFEKLIGESSYIVIPNDRVAPGETFKNWNV